LENPEEDYKNMDFSSLMSTIGKTVSEIASSAVATV
jgi:hypothetical protein